MSKILEIFNTMEYGPAPEAPDAVKAWLDEHGRKFGLFINNEWVTPKGAKFYPSYNPSNGELLAETTQAEKKDVDAAVAAARGAFKTWSKTPGVTRARYLYAIARNIQKHSRLLAVLESMDNGKPIRESRDIDVPLLARHFYYYAGWAQLMETELRDYQPVGVVGQIIPWNFPLLMLAWKIAPAIAMGNTVVLKPASYTRLTALLFAEIVAEAGLPAGVVNVITGSSSAGSMIVEHPDVDKIAFTGSTDVGRTLRKQTAGSGKKLSLELGGKSPFVVFDDADLDGAVEGVVDAIWFNQGQVCCAGSRLIVQENVAGKFIQKLKARMEHMRVGDPLDKAIDMGAIVDQSQWDTIDGWVKTGIAEGGECFQPNIALPEKGLFYKPTLITGLDPAAATVQEEIFGPVLVSLTFRTPSEAIDLANNTRYGLAASVWSDNINLALDVASKIKAGSVWVNCTNQFDGASGFGGYRESGYGREGGREGLFEYLRPKWMDRPRPEFVLDEKKKWGEHVPTLPSQPTVARANGHSLPPIDRTPKMYIGGKQVRPDGAYTTTVLNAKGKIVGQVGDGNRKDIRDAVEAAHAAHVAKPGWAMRHGYNRSQILYFIAENLDARNAEFVKRIVEMTGRTQKSAQAEVDTAVERLFSYAAWADKYGGTVQETTLRGITVAVNEPVGVIGIACPDEMPLLGFVSLMAPAIARGNTVVMIPSQKYPLSAMDFYQVLDTSDVPGGVVNIVTGDRDHLVKTLVQHEDVDSVWYFGSAEGSYHVENESAANMKRTWTGYGLPRDWLDREQGEGHEFLHEATQVKNIWVPTGE
ncbi:MAG TPA: aldehyde dehydrogenase family protein [Anaerolineales bacterium]|mgnify:CR=1 FL=1|nr:aldehyde dehydrogenase [Anaerolineae bacterium]HRJ56075.1 aldehyde dehydrogenase family protein [Anaerolineales bacterium]HRK91228.1 aldehyde dehydrogenase family protein [Anaerolineales bacterium]